MQSDREKEGSDYRVLGSILRNIRHDQELTMRDIAERAGIPHSFVGKIENAERRLDVVEFVRYCNLLGAEPDKVFETFRNQIKKEALSDC